MIRLKINYSIGGSGFLADPKVPEETPCVTDPPMSTTEEDDTGFTLVEKKKKTSKPPCAPITRIDKQFAIDTIKNYFSKFRDVLAVYLYGSVARNTHKQSSDVDILTFWNYHIPDSVDIKNMKEELTKLLGKKVEDLTYYKYNCSNTYQEGIKRITQTYIINVKQDAILVYKSDKRKEDFDPLRDMIITDVAETGYEQEE